MHAGKMRFTEVVLAICSIGQLLGFVIFLKGFFPVKEAVTGYANWENIGDNVLGGGRPPEKYFSRMVFILIDALRADFVLPDSESSLPKMEFLRNKILANETFSFVAKAHPPTVTLPRIKALTTGGIPGFIDVVLNFDSKSLMEDNIVTQLKRAGKRMVFYGDDTWMRLFPDHFVRTDGTTSFFVTDYTEVDNNVTRHLDRELVLSPDWDVMILHYLGLDHIGHLAGPKSSLVEPKLEEMDHIVKRIYHAVKEMDLSRNESSLVFVCGDHGMSDQGSHGGSSLSETLTPFVFLSPQYENHKGMGFQKDHKIYQIDLAPTLSLLLGLPVPQNSLGTLAMDLFTTLEPREKLQMANINAKQILKVFEQNNPQYQRDDSYLIYQRAVKQHENWLEFFSSTNQSPKPSQLQELSEKVLALYEKAMIGMRSTIASSLAEYDLHAMGVGIAVIWMVLFIQLILYHFLSQQLTPSSVICYQSIPWAMLAEAMYIRVHTTLCTCNHKSALLCSTVSYTWTLNLVPAVVLWVFVLVFWGFLQRSCSADSAPGNRNQPKYELNHSLFLLFGTLGHTLSMLASSFIEEEHQTWYFLTVTINMILCFINSKNYILNNTGITELDTEGKSIHSQTCIHRQTKVCPHCFVNNTCSSKKCSCHGVVKRSDDDNTNDAAGCSMERESECYSETYSANSKMDKPSCQPVKKDRVESLISVVCGIGVLVLCRVCRTWNRTGDKWAHLPDVGDSLTSPEYKLVLSVVSALSLLILSAIVRIKFNILNWWLFNMGAVCVYMFRSALGDLASLGFYTSQSKGVLEARSVYFIIFLIFVQSLYHLKCEISSRKPITKDQNKTYSIPKVFKVIFDHAQLGFVVLMLLLVRPHNIALVAMEYVQLLLVQKVILSMNLGVLSTTLIHIWMGQAAFFYQGNSNSLTTVDVSAGYIGIESYNPTVIGILLAFATYAGPILWILGLVCTLSYQALNEQSHGGDLKAIDIKYLRQFSQALLVVSISRTLPMSLYVVLVTVERYHLFVWTVFSPKLLYDGMHAVVLGIISILVLIMKSLFSIYLD